jgi:hypothetical protein
MLAPLAVSAWSGHDSDKGTYVEIDEGNLVRAGQDIEIYDSNSGEYKSVEVQSITGNGTGVQVEIYESSTDEYRTLDMD